jgi:hypothetical protein
LEENSGNLSIFHKMNGTQYLLTVFACIFLLPLNATSQTLELKEICSIGYQTDYTSIADRNKDDLFPKGNTVGFVHFYRGLSLLRQRAYHESILKAPSTTQQSTAHYATFTWALLSCS